MLCNGDSIVSDEAGVGDIVKEIVEKIKMGFLGLEEGFHFLVVYGK